MMIAINNTRDLSLTVGRFYMPFNKTTAEEAVFSLPYIDVADGGKSLNIFFVTCGACYNEVGYKETCTAVSGKWLFKEP